MVALAVFAIAGLLAIAAVVAAIGYSDFNGAS